MSQTTAFNVIGMTCSHCVNAVSTEINRIPGVTAVDVDLARGYVEVTSDGALDPATVRAAVDEAGYELTP